MRAPGHGWARVGFGIGIVTSVAANVAHSYVPPEGVEEWHPPVGALIVAAFWPTALLICIEVISRVHWPSGKKWVLLRYGGLTAVAAIAAVISYRHMSGLLHSYGEDGLSAALGPLAVDGLMVVCSGALMAISDRQRALQQAPEVPVAVEVLPDPPAVPDELTEHDPLPEKTEPPAVAELPLPTPAASGNGNGKRPRPKNGNGTRQPVSLATRQEEARQAYRRSVEEGLPLTGEQIGELFHKSPRWGRLRIAEVRQENSAPS